MLVSSKRTFRKPLLCRHKLRPRFNHSCTFPIVDRRREGVSGMAKFSEANYQSRRIKLSHQIADAQRAYTEATIALEFGEGDQAAVNAAREQITALKDQLVGVEAAFQRSQAQAVAEKAASERSGRLAAIKAVEASLKKRKAAADDMAEAAAAL